MRIPAQITKGDSISWLDDASVDNLRNPISPGVWTLKYKISGQSSFKEVTATVEGSQWKSSLTATETDALTAGQYYWQAIATKDTDVVTLGRGKLTILPNLTATGDNRSQVKKDLDAVQEAMRAIVTGGAVLKYAINGRQVEKMSMDDLIRLESKLKIDLKREEQALGSSGRTSNNTFVRF